ncbi:MAG: toxin-activating lysine-acyltransferase [Burkholderiaceae bacterium]|nr:toxin-activating lysine-acyltransferase [Burkholderiaceae bacterium]MDO9090338.1 toxin-activating lysine-acyltransferase [Burkholderiaceae bacterium]MDP1969251.1 toxin-activating lysine-acyltransferase [Burkholderiaceae bacterium]
MNTTAEQEIAQTPAADSAGPDLTAIARLAREQARSVLAKLPLLGPVTWLMMQQGATRHTLISDLEWRVMPALMFQQAKLYMRDEAPIAYASWALLSPETALRYRTAPHQLTAADWKSGDEVWLVDLFTPFGGAHEVLSDLRQQVFPGQVIHQIAPATDGLAEVISWPKG